ncbi:MAG: TetR/AcrR family transcriptional regulator [Bacteroidia bacterium]|nr:TetR/AcrR family transcriptional regulator [Bacteroidia bacterium]
MGITERKEREKEEMRKKIIDVAFDMFLEDGFEGTSLREIAKRIEYSPATIYLYYKDKDALFFDIQKKCFLKLVAAYNDAGVPTIKNPFERLRAMGRVYLKFNMKNPQCFNLMFLHNSPMAEFKKEDRMDKHGNAVGFLKDTIAECLEKKMIKGTDPLELRLEVWAITHGLCTLYVNKSYEVAGLTRTQAEEHMKNAWENYLARIKA